MILNPELTALLDAARNRKHWAEILNTALGTSKRFRIFDGEIECRNVAMKESKITASDDGLFMAGAFYNNTAIAATNLLAGNGSARIEGGGHVITLTLGLRGSGKELTLHKDLPADGGIGNSGIMIRAPKKLPVAHTVDFQNKPYEEKKHAIKHSFAEVDPSKSRWERTMHRDHP